MSSNTSVKITEVGDVEAYLLRMNALVRTKALKAAIAAGCKVVRDRAKELAPVGDGDLRRSISYVVREYQDGTVVVGVVGPKRGKAASGKDPGRYGRLVEYGHQVANRSGGKETVNAHPFLRPAADATEVDQEVAVIASLTQSMKGA